MDSSKDTTLENNDCNNNNNNNNNSYNNSCDEWNGGLLTHQQSLDLREGLEDLMEHIQKHKHEEPSSSFEERYLLLVSSHPPESLTKAVEMTDQELWNQKGETYLETKASQRLPIHLACDKGAPLSIVQSLLEADAAFETILRPDKWGDLPIHTACSRAATALTKADREYARPLWETTARKDAVEIIRLLLEADKDKKTLLVKDVYESLPLHTAARYNAPVSAIRMLVEGDSSKTTLYTEGLHGQFPLTVACRSGSPSPEVLKVLIEYDDDNNNNNNTNSSAQRPSTVLHKDATGRLPIHVFMLRNQCPVSLKILLNAMLGCKDCSNDGRPLSRNSILRLGLDAWKKQLLWMIAAMDGRDLYERDFTTRDKLDVICDELKAFYEVCITLELVVWKMSCLRVQETEDKEHRRIVGGADIILPNVLSYLEDEPVGNILQKFRSYGYITRV